MHAALERRAFLFLFCVALERCCCFTNSQLSMLYALYHVRVTQVISCYFNKSLCVIFCLAQSVFKDLQSEHLVCLCISYRELVCIACTSISIRMQEHARLYGHQLPTKCFSEQFVCTNRSHQSRGRSEDMHSLQKN